MMFGKKANIKDIITYVVMGLGIIIIVGVMLRIFGVL